MKRHRFESADILVVDGQVLDGSRPALLANLPGILRGEGVFESFLVRDGQRPPFLDLHNTRLHHSAALLRMDLQGRGLSEDWSHLAGLLGAGNWRVRYTVLRGLQRSLIRMWTAGVADPPPHEVDLVLSNCRLDPAHPLAGAKTTSRAAYQVAHAEAVEAGAFDAILPTIDGDLAECTSSNLLLWSDGELRTAPLERGILGGVTRQILLQSCLVGGLRVRESKIWQKDLAQTAEVLVTNAVIGVIPVCRILGVDQVFPGARGPAAVRIREIYSEVVAARARAASSSSSDPAAESKP